jgi:hypothetical protein
MKMNHLVPQKAGSLITFEVVSGSEELCTAELGAVTETRHAQPKSNSTNGTLILCGLEVFKNKRLPQNTGLFCSRIFAEVGLHRITELYGEIPHRWPRSPRWPA